MTVHVTADQIRQAVTPHPALARHIAHIQISARRKSLGMAISPGDDGITLQVPATASPDEVVTLLSRNRDRIGALLVKANKCVPDHPVKEFVRWEGYLWLGRSSRLEIVDQAPEPVQLVNTGQWWMQATRQAVQQGARPFIDWYSREGTAWLAAETPHWWARMAPRHPMPTIQAADIGRRRWGTYDAATHEIRIAWQTLQLRPHLVRHILVHELVHATHPAGKPHGTEFWREFERTMPGARQDQRELADAGRSLWMGDVAVTSTRQDT